MSICLSCGKLGQEEGKACSACNNLEILDFMNNKNYKGRYGIISRIAELTKDNPNFTTFNFSDLITDWEEKAKLGSLEALDLVACCWRMGADGIDPNPEKEAYWNEKAAEAGIISAYTLIGEMYRDGYGITRDESKGIYWYLKAAENNYSYASFEAALCFENKTYKYQLLHKCVECGCIDAVYDLGMCYLNGEGVEKNQNKAVELFKTGVEGGYAKAYHVLWACYHFGMGVEKDDIKAFQIIQKGAETGDPDCEGELGNCYRLGTGVEQNDVTAIDWWKKAADKGVAMYICKVANAYLEGKHIELDPNKALELFQIAADKGDPFAQYQLGTEYSAGRIVKKNYGEAVKWFDKAAKNGEEGAMYKLGLCYQEGLGVQKNDNRAQELFKEAASKGNTSARDYLNAQENPKSTSQEEVITKRNTSLLLKSPFLSSLVIGGLFALITPAINFFDIFDISRRDHQGVGLLFGGILFLLLWFILTITKRIKVSSNILSQIQSQPDTNYDIVLHGSGLYSLVFDTHNERIAFMNLRKQSVFYYDYSQITRWSHEWTERSNNGSISNIDNRLIFRTSDVSRPLIEVPVQSYRFGQEWQARLSAMFNQ